jgi:MFS family permease
MAALCLCGTGFGAIVFYSSTQTLIQTSVPDHLRGRIMGVWMLVYSGSVRWGPSGRTPGAIKDAASRPGQGPLGRICAGGGAEERPRGP